MALVLIPLGFALPWLAGVAWIRLKDREAVFPHDETIPSAGDSMLQNR